MFRKNDILQYSLFYDHQELPGPQEETPETARPNGVSYVCGTLILGGN